MPSAARAKRGETNGADPPCHDAPRAGDSIITLSLAAHAKQRRTEPRRPPAGTPRHATWDFSIAANGARDTCQLLAERRPDSSSSRRTRAHDIVAKRRTRPNVHRLQIWLVDRVYGSSRTLRRVAGVGDGSYAAIRPRCLRGPSFSLSPQTKNRSCFDKSCGVRAFQRASQLPAPCPSAN